MGFTSAFTRALYTFAMADPANVAQLQALQNTALMQVLSTPDGTLLAQVEGMLNGKTFQFKVDRSLTQLIGDLDEVLQTVAGTRVCVTQADFTIIQL